MSEEIEIVKIHSSRLNPRKHFDEEKLQELAQSIASEGLQQAITVRPSKDNVGNYEVVIGERRLRACKLLEMDTIKAVVEEMDDSTARTVMLIENLQREDLTPLEEGTTIVELIEVHGKTEKQIGNEIGKSESYVSRRYTLTKKLAPVVKRLMEKGNDLASGKLDYTIAREIVNLSHADQEDLAQKALDYGLTKENVIKRMKDAEKLEAVIQKLDKGEFREQMEEKYLPKKFDIDILADLEVDVFFEKGSSMYASLYNTRYNRDLVLLIQKMERFRGCYRKETTTIEWGRTAGDVAEAREKFNELLKKDGLYLAFIVKV